MDYSQMEKKCLRKKVSLSLERIVFAFALNNGNVTELQQYILVAKQKTESIMGV